MARYHVDNRMAGSQQAVSTTYKTALAVTAATATLCRGRAVSFKIGPDGAPNATDCQIIYTVERQTAAGTSSAATPVADRASPASRRRPTRPSPTWSTRLRPLR